MNTHKLIMLAGVIATLALVNIAGAADAQQQSAASMGTTSTSRPGNRPFEYVQRATNSRGEFVRHLTLSRNGRALLTTLYFDRPPDSIQTGTWKRGSRATRLSITLNQQNGRPYRETILLTGTPGRSGTLSGVGDNARQYSAYGLNFVPRPDINLKFNLESKTTANGVNDGVLKIEGNGIKSTVVSHIAGVRRTIDGNDLVYWTSGGGGGYQNEGQILYFFNTLTGRSRKLATFPFRITAINGIRSPSGRSYFVVSLAGTGGQGTRMVSVVDPLRERTIKEWPNSSLASIAASGRITVQSNTGNGIKAIRAAMLDAIR